MFKQIIAGTMLSAALVGSTSSLAQATAGSYTATTRPAAARPANAGELVSAKAIPNLDPSLAAVSSRADRILYRSVSLDGQSIVVSGVLLLPKGKAPAGGWPIVSWAHGSSGIADQCAPSTVKNAAGNVDLYGYGGLIAEFLKAGYAVVATDYEGLGTPGEHPYIIADSEGRSVIDAVRAGINADHSLSKSWFAVGHSQGGQGAIAAGELADSWGAGLDFRGTVGLAPVTNIGAAYLYGSPGPVDRGFYLLALQGLKTQHPDLRIADYLGPQALAMMPEAQKECTLKIWQDFSANLGNKIGDFQFTPQTPEAALAIQPLLDEQSVPRGRTPGPMLLLQGDHDPSIKRAVTFQAVENARSAGTVVDFRIYPDKDHYSVLGDAKSGGAATDVVAWLNSHKSL